MKRRGLLGILASAGFIGTTPAAAPLLVTGSKHIMAPPLNIPDGPQPGISDAYGVAHEAAPLSKLAAKRGYLVERIAQAKARGAFRKWLFKKAPYMIPDHIGPTPYTEPRDTAHYDSLKSVSPVMREQFKRDKQEQRAYQYWLEYPEKRAKSFQFQLLNLDKDFDSDF